MASLVYILCALASAACALLLTRGYFRSRERLLLWSSLCFIFLTISDVLLFIDLAVLPNSIDLSLLRTVPALIGVGILLVGLIWEAR
jgi:hypothetical protein